jgi:hypothetical protein
VLYAHRLARPYIFRRLEFILSRKQGTFGLDGTSRHGIDRDLLFSTVACHLTNNGSDGTFRIAIDGVSEDTLGLTSD